MMNTLNKMKMKHNVLGRLFLLAIFLSISACHTNTSQSAQPSSKATPQMTQAEMVRALSAGSTAVPKYGSSGSTLTAPKL